VTLLEKYNAMVDTLRSVVTLCGDGDADELAQHTARLAEKTLSDIGEHMECEACGNGESTYCGSFCEWHLADHVAECEVCARDF
jgi:hypothetical protein